jgi:protein disulfide-isomerase
MKIEIWSDVMCPFCYIGKRHLEKAMALLPFKNEVEIEWKSYQLNPDYHNTTNESLLDYLARNKGMSVDQAKQLTESVSMMAKNVDLDLDFAKSKPANSFNAHRLLQFAKTKNLQDEAEEALFYAHFVEGKDVANNDVLLAIGEKIDLPKPELTQLLQSDDFSHEVKYDIYESQQIGVKGVPFFLLNEKYGLSGAQPIEAFVEAITQAFNDKS